VILCCREYQNSVKESVHSLIDQCIDDLKLRPYFKVTDYEIRHKITGSRFIFAGLKHNVDNIRSLQGVTHTWIEEAANISANSWRVLKPTIRENNSEIWATFNPKNKTDILSQEFVENEPPPNSFVTKISYRDNPYFNEVLRLEMERDKLRDFGMYIHVWEGEYLEHSDAQIFKDKWAVSTFEEPYGVHKYFGLDFGFSQDPTAGIRCYIIDNILYISHEAVEKGLEATKIGDLLERKLPDVRKYIVYADSARPDTIYTMQKQGYNVRAVEKGKGSVEDGIEHIKTFDKVLIHPRCTHTLNEFNRYSYEVDERSGDITTKIVDKYNHCIDALRYALERCMRTAKTDYSKYRPNLARF